MNFIHGTVLALALMLGLPTLAQLAALTIGG